MQCNFDMLSLRTRTLPRPFTAAQALAVAAVMSSGCVGHSAPRATVQTPAQVDITQLWVEPTDIESRDLFQGPARAEWAPEESATFTLVKADRKGYSPGFEVRDAKGMNWDVKTGPEAQTEMVTSRILWALGYHQPPIYYLPTWTLAGGDQGTHSGGRFRPALSDRKVVGDWSWYENEFVDSMPFKGLVVANMVLNNWDWKTSNNKIYDVHNADGTTTREYVVRDLGASLGKTSFPRALRFTPARGFGQGSRNDLEDFESQGFIKGVDGSRVEFDYRGIHQAMVKTVTVEQVVWACRLMARVSDAQYDDAFRAGGYSEDVRRRYVAKLKSKIAEGLALQGS
jgi:hypothetical protein